VSVVSVTSRTPTTPEYCYGATDQIGRAWVQGYNMTQWDYTHAAQKNYMTATIIPV